jgi:copper chaperone CopZ
LKRNTARAERLKAGLEATPGVLDCDVNVLTGSVTVRYDRDVITAEEITRELSRSGAISANAPALRNAANKDLFSGAQMYKASGSVGKFIVGFAVEKLVERSALALVGAIL